MIDPSTSPHGSDVNCWDVSQVTDMSYPFCYVSPPHDWYDNELDDPLFLSFNEPLGCWNVSKVTNMESIFSDESLTLDHGICRRHVFHVV